MITQRQSQALEEIARDAFERINRVTPRGPGEIRLALVLALPYGTVEEFTLDDNLADTAAGGRTFEEALRELLAKSTEEALDKELAELQLLVATVTAAKAKVVKAREDNEKATPATPAP
jgi:hypothetical protein